MAVLTGREVDPTQIGSFRERSSFVSLVTSYDTQHHVRSGAAIGKIIGGGGLAIFYFTLDHEFHHQGRI